MCVRVIIRAMSAKPEVKGFTDYGASPCHFVYICTKLAVSAGTAAPVAGAVAPASAATAPAAPVVDVAYSAGLTA